MGTKALKIRLFYGPEAEIFAGFKNQHFGGAMLSVTAWWLDYCFYAWLSAFYNWTFHAKYRSQKQNVFQCISQNTLTVQSNNTQYPFINAKHLQISLTKKIGIAWQAGDIVKSELLQDKKQDLRLFFSPNWFFSVFLCAEFYAKYCAFFYASHLSRHHTIFSVTLLGWVNL